VEFTIPVSITRSLLTVSLPDMAQTATSAKGIPTTNDIAAMVVVEYLIFGARLTRPDLAEGDVELVDSPVIPSPAIVSTTTSSSACSKLWAQINVSSKV
jgi:hypothetical protein